ncbi:MAG: GNAT family N-acetyltransferase [Bacteroidota bacterium]
MFQLVRTTAEQADFIELVSELDAFLAVTDGEEHAFYNQFNGIAGLQYVLVAYLEEEPIGCGAIKPWNATTMEVKRMYVREDRRGNGYAKMILAALEDWAKELGAERCLLETGARQVAAMALYANAGYDLLLANYGQYVGVENSRCFEKEL